MEPKDVAKEIDSIIDKVSPLLRNHSPLAASMALSILAAHGVLHDGGEEADFIAIAKASWQRSCEIHRASCSS